MISLRHMFVYINVYECIFITIYKFVIFKFNFSEYPGNINGVEQIQGFIFVFINYAIQNHSCY